ncbi:MAG: DUF6491 family protein [Phenylobacterium sp.]|uniref:DUF6491 family protein n=1 Tax=Phenylobacterium sp. TaxID=1871053 RepID=UPI0027354DB9|nr:DUF6491 family protein [Phenylobacterium sp.]MDP3749851.1 DUF6491 family protein [Phenylobacterium sp.]
MTRTEFWMAATAVLALSAAGFAPAFAADPAGAKPQRQCFSARNVSNFSAVDDRTVNLRVGVKDVYRLDLLGPCHDIDWEHQIAIQSRGSSWICSGLDATIITRSPIGPQRCAVRTIRKLSLAEIAALPPKHKP